MKMLDVEIIHKHLSELESALSYLKDKKSISEKQLINDYEQRLAIERAFHLAIQNTIDIGSHILASLGINDIESYADIPKKLSEAKIIQPTLSGKLANMAKFRNILVHDYIKIESKKLISFLKNNLSDFSEFSKNIIKYLAKYGS